MAKSRYFPNRTIFNPQRQEPVHFATWNVPINMRGYDPINLLAGQQYSEYIWKFGDRIDRLAFHHLGDDQYWWIIALVNNINYPFSSGGLVAGKVLIIPSNVRDVLDKLM